MATDEGALAALFAAEPATGAPAHEAYATQWKSLARSEPLNAALWIRQHANPAADGGAMKAKMDAVAAAAKNYALEKRKEVPGGT